MKKLFQRIIKYIFSMGLMLYSLTIGMFTEKGRYLHSIVCQYFGFAFLKPKLPKIPWKSVASESPVKLMELEIQDGNMPVHELAIICGIIKKEKPSAIMEIGTMNGRTTVNMAVNSTENCAIFTLDLPADELANTRYKISERYQAHVKKEMSGELFARKSIEEFPEKQKITQLLGDSGSFDFSPYYNAIDFIFIDGSHDYEYVLNDSEVALKLLRDGKGIILWHDYRVGIDVVKALDVFQTQHPDFNIRHIENTDFAYLKI